jgi:hypothetical protein
LATPSVPPTRIREIHNSGSDGQLDKVFILASSIPPSRRLHDLAWERLGARIYLMAFGT